MVFPRVCITDLPKLFSIEGDSGEAAQFGIGILGSVMMYLPKENVSFAIAVEIAKAHVASDTEAFNLELLPKDQFRIGRNSLSFLRLQFDPSRGDARSF